MQVSADTRVLNVMGCRSVQYGSFEDYVVLLTGSCRRLGMTPVFVYAEEPADGRFRRRIERAGGVLEVVPGTDVPTAAGARAIWRSIAEHRPAIVHGHFGRAGYLAPLLGRVRGVPVTLLSKHQTSWPTVTTATRLVYTGLARAFTSVLVGAAPVGDELRGLGVPAEKITTVLFPGIDTDRYVPRPELRGEVRDRIGVSDDAPLVTAVSHMHQKKGVQYLLGAIPSVLSMHPAVSLAIVGDGPYRAHLEALSAAGGHADRVKFLGHRPDVPEILAASDIFVCPSLCEGGCAGSLEAMSVGLPVVSTPVGIARDLIIHSDSGRVVDPASASALAEGLNDVLGRPREWAAMGMRGRASVAAEASAQRTADLLAQVYADALAAAS